MPPRRFFTDLGEDVVLEDQQAHKLLHLGRYAYWSDESGKLEVCFVSDDLETLKTLYGDLPVRNIKEKK